MFVKNKDNSFHMHYQILTKQGEKESFYIVCADFEELELKNILKTIDFWEESREQYRDYKISDRYFCSLVGGDYFAITGSNTNQFSFALANENAIREFKERIEHIFLEVSYG